MSQNVVVADHYDFAGKQLHGGCDACPPIQCKFMVIQPLLTVSYGISLSQGVRTLCRQYISNSFAVTWFCVRHAELA